MVLVLVIGDMHIPARENALPKKFREMLVPGKIQKVLCTGNLYTKEMMDFLKGVAGDVHVVKGDFDTAEYPETAVVEIEGHKIGLCHGHQIVPWGDHQMLAAMQRQLDCDILITGHTHKVECFEMNGKFFVNPGSATGAYSPTAKGVIPSFLLMDIRKDVVSCFLYKIVDGKLHVDRNEYHP